MKTKKLILMIMLLLFAQAACAEKILILNLNYDNGKVSIIDEIETYGYYPDRKIQPDAGYKAEIISVDDDVIYSFRFEVPLEHYTDIHMDGKTQGGLVRVDNTDFALILPSLPDAKQINIYNEKEENVLTADLREKRLTITIPIILASAILAAIIVYIILKKKKS
ncbi:hypothetical protein KY360_02865 [Candidatus Woesearchaeota archaeon]|nr:hypothetical protein [Candidatus Woesearchaeota archaeon]